MTSDTVPTDRPSDHLVPGWPGAQAFTRVALPLILLGALVLRVGAVGFGNDTLSFQVDEDLNVSLPLTLSWTGFNPLDFHYPAFLWYALWGLDRAASWVGHLNQQFSHGWDLRQFDRDPVRFFLLGRVLSVGFGTATVFLVYRVGRRLISPDQGLLAAAFLAGAFLHVRDSALATPDSAMTFFVVLSLLGAAIVLQEGHAQGYLLAGVATGLATATKYNAALVFVALIIAHWRHAAQRDEPVWRIVTAPRLLGALLVMASIFTAVNPYFLLDWPEALADIWRYSLVLQEGMYRSPTVGWWYHVSVSLRYGLGIGLLGLALAGIVPAIRGRMV
jgi:hypothetical protein